MSQAKLIVLQNAKMGGVDFCTNSQEICTISTSINEVLRGQFPRKTWAVLVEMFGISERAAKYKLSATSRYTDAEICRLLRSEFGFDILTAMMADSRPRWWVTAVKAITLGAVRRRQQSDQQLVMALEGGAPASTLVARRRLKGAINADKSLSAALARAEASLVIPDAHADRDRGHEAGGNDRLRNRSVASRSVKCR